MNIQNKLFIVIISFSFFLISTTVLLVQWSIDKGMIEYVNTREIKASAPVINALEKHYAKVESWDLLQGNHQRFLRLLSENLEGGDFALEQPQPRRGKRPPKPGSMFEDKGNHKRPPRGGDWQRPPHKQPAIPHHLPSYALLNIDKEMIVGNYPDTKEYSFSPITVNKVTVGYFAISKRSEITENYDLDFISQQHNALWLLATVIMLLMVFVTIPLARHLVQPIKQLAKGMHNLTQGNYIQTIKLNRQDELGELSRDFNELAHTLEANEEARKRWLANISHELRTPVAILQGELEAMIDGVRSLSIENVESAHQEMKHLRKLIDDLHMLTSADIGGMTYRKSSLNISEFLKTESNKYKGYLAESNLELSTDISCTKTLVMADATRLSQLMDNLIANCVKYATKGTSVNISLLNVATNVVRIIIEDDGEGVADNHLKNLFEHLYRVEDSRNRDTGGAGLGLSICAQIIKAHNGTIEAKRSSLGGLAVIIDLPVATSTKESINSN
jgi:two-component system sensor histidine kinase BaeS